MQSRLLTSSPCGALAAGSRRTPIAALSQAAASTWLASLSLRLMHARRLRLSWGRSVRGFSMNVKTRTVRSADTTDALVPLTDEELYRVAGGCFN
jgi:hypothetical protein